ncbi:MAG: electron transfer flavoprotein subunit beta/FixA family protein [Desulfobulbaceae bacterium]|jgi:electron transfer flavoprotein beta subunit|nr:electron transfer flavoprotein subunit beta/FixA family protein [Desulfobulbaceae bacterium]
MMKIFVCVKQVPDTRDIRLDPVTHTLSREGVQSIMNPYDQHALEEAVRLKEALGGEVTVISMGPPQAEEMLRLAVSLGADKAVLVSDRAFAGADTCATSYALAKTVAHLGGCDLVLCGKQAIDGDTAQVGPGLAARLDMPFATCIQKICDASGASLVVERMMDDGYDVVEIGLPALLTVVKDINEPRVPSLKGKMRAKSVTISRLNAADIGADPALCGLPGSPTQVAKVFPPPSRGHRVTLAGDIDQQIEQLVGRLAGYFS